MAMTSKIIYNKEHKKDSLTYGATGKKQKGDRWHQTNCCKEKLQKLEIQINPKKSAKIEVVKGKLNTNQHNVIFFNLVCIKEANTLLFP